MTDDYPILFYDGACGLCDRSVRWTMAHDRARRFRFAPLQGATYANIKRADAPEDLSSLVVVDGDRLLTRSDAVLHVLRTVGGVWGVFGAIARLVPRVIRDRCYRIVAHRRLRWFGGAEACRLPSMEERDLLLP